MVFTFSCFNAHSQAHKQKKTVHLSSDAMQKTLEDSSHTDALNNISCLPAANSSNLKIELDTVKSCADCTTDISAVDGNSNSDEVESGHDILVLKGIQMKKSRSLGTGLDMKGMDSGGSASEDGIDQQFFCNESHDNCVSLVPVGANYSGTSQLNEFQEPNPSESLHVHGDVGNNGSTFSVGDAPLSEKDSHENLSDAQLSGGDHTPTTPVFEKSRALPNIASPGHFITYSVRRIRSAEDLNVMDSRRKEMLTNEVGPRALQHEERTNTVITNNDRNHSDDPVDDSCISYNYVGLAKDWIVPVGDELDVNDNHGGDFSFHQKAESPGKDFKVKRIEEWVVDLQHCIPLEESDELPASDDHTVPTGRSTLVVSPATQVEGKASPGMEAVKKYISSLSPAATAAQLVNYGLAVIPFLSPFSSLRALNLSGNAIVRITAGSLPRGLHVLNLSKNKISTIEGLRELTRLRLLDLSYNRMLRIGHGLASCSSLKELYLAGNKISEVEGLHRLLKLNVLDLRFNKISTTKCLGQLAANYNSLQAISLEGNPAQKNVGDEQVKKYLQGLLPHLTYFNREPIKAGTLKDTADRSARLGIGAHHMDRGLKSDLKLMRKGTHGTTSKVVSSSTHGRRSHATAASLKPSKSKHARLPPIGMKPAAQQDHLLDLGNNVSPSFRPDLFIRRSRSEGTLAPL